MDSADFTDVQLPAALPEGEHDLTLRFTGSITLDWLRIAEA